MANFWRSMIMRRRQVAANMGSGAAVAGTPPTSDFSVAANSQLVAVLLAEF